MAAAGMTPRTLFVACILATACERANPPASRTGGSPASASSSAIDVGAAAATAKPWDDELGAVVATPSLDSGTPVLFVRDTANGADLPVELFTHDDQVSSAMLRPGATIRSCAWRRNASLTLHGADGTPNNWALALSPGIAIPVGVDGIEDLSPRDSAAVVARISLLVSAIPEDSSSGPYRGLPIVVRDAWRFTLADSTAVSVAVATRSLNVESNPRAQAVMLIAEPDPSLGAGHWRTAYWERVAGPEDRVEGMDLLAAFRLHGATPAVALVRESEAGPQVEIVERRSPGTWTVRWTSGALPCTKR
ncbi:MAG: hypothetical protein ACREN6_16920 [Gemmatimonadaceae bacterium]